MLRALDAYLETLCADAANDVHVLCPPNGALPSNGFGPAGPRRVHACGAITRLALRRLPSIGRPGLPRDFDLALIHNGFAAPAWPSTPGRWSAFAIMTNRANSPAWTL